MWFLSLVFSTRCHPLIHLARCYNRKPVIHSVLIMAEILLMRTRNKAICVIRNAQVKCCSNTINLWKHLISRIRRHDFRNEWMNEWSDALFVYYTHTKAWTSSRCFHLLPSHYMMILTRISSPAALRVTSFAFYRFIWENYRHIYGWVPKLGIKSVSGLNYERPEYR